MRLLSALAMMLLSAGCAIGPSATSSRATGPGTSPALATANAALAGVAAGPALSAEMLGNSERALIAFRASCPQLLEREEVSGLTSPADWAAACDAARGWDWQEAERFFSLYFETARIGDGSAFATGYFVPEISGSRTRREGFDVPVYAMPDDLVRGWPVPMAEREGEPPLSRQLPDGSFIPYYSRAEIEDGALESAAPVIGWAADPVEFFFLQIQGSGRLRTPEGEVIQIGYAGQNGRGYTSIGRVMRERGLLGEGADQYAASMQGIMAYLREHPEDGRALMRENESWIFFAERSEGALGTLGVPVAGRASIAVDPRFVPLGAPVWLDLERDEADGLWIAQDTGGAIKGANRFDTFWGAGPEAREIAGTMSAAGSALVLLPKGTLARLAGDASSEGDRP